ncbi:MAG: hypothetical protein NVS9B15_26190 [Acidobacteriaceae bacterium]
MKVRIILALLTVGLLYVADAVIAAHRTATVPVQRTYLIPLKSGRTEYSSPEFLDEVCGRAVLPHRGRKPCWYLKRHTQQEVRIDTGSEVDNPH